MSQEQINPDTDKIIEFYKKRASYHGDQNAVLDGTPTQSVRFTNIMLDYLTRNALLENLKAKASDIVLDYGCGVGRVSFHVAKQAKEVYGVDISPDLLNIANTTKKNKGINNIHFQQLDPNNPVFPDKVFNKIFALGVMLHLGEEGLAKNLPQLHKQLANDGTLCLLEYTRDKTEIGKHEVIIRSVDDFKKDFAKYGFECYEVKPVIRMPSYALSIWKKINKDWKWILPILWQVEKQTTLRKPEHIEYHWHILKFRKV